MFIIGIFVFVVVIGFTILLGTVLPTFIDYPSIIFVLGSNAALLIATSSIEDFRYGMRALRIKDGEINSVKLNEAIHAFNMLQKATVGISVLGFLIGIISMLSRLNAPSSIGPSLAVALLIAFYSVSLSLIVITPVKYILCRMERKNRSAMGSGSLAEEI